MNIKESAEEMGLDESAFLELVELFVKKTGSDLESLRSALEAKSSSGVAEAAHSIKGTSANLGFTDLFNLAKDIELNARVNILKGAIEKAAEIEGKMCMLRSSP